MTIDGYPEGEATSGGQAGAPLHPQRVRDHFTRRGGRLFHTDIPKRTR